MQMLYPNSNFTGDCSQGSNWQHVKFVFGNGFINGMQIAVNLINNAFPGPRKASNLWLYC